MENTITKWVLGHKVALHNTSGDYDLAYGETPAGVQGPPPHSHAHLTESFLITEGEMEFFVAGEVKVVRAGETVNLPENTIHTFSNKSNKPCKWVNIHSPKGFRRFFEIMGIEADIENAQNKSISEAIINEVIGTAKDYDMHIQN